MSDFISYFSYHYILPLIPYYVACSLHYYFIIFCVFSFVFSLYFLFHRVSSFISFTHIVFISLLTLFSALFYNFLPFTSSSLTAWLSPHFSHSSLTAFINCRWLHFLLFMPCFVSCSSPFGFYKRLCPLLICLRSLPPPPATSAFLSFSQHWRRCFAATPLTVCL